MFKVYFESGLGIIPVLFGKNPGFQNWQRYCEELPTEQQVTEWERLHSDKNIGLPCGPANNLIAIDIDDDDPEIANLVPPSPVRKRGRKGETRFFRFNSSVRAEKLYRWKSGQKAGAPSVEILSTGNQTVLPPSIHPDTKVAYVWITNDTLLNYPVKDLPEITSEGLDPVRDYLTREMGALSQAKKISVLTNDDPTRLSPHGAQNQLKTICTAIIAECPSVDDGVRRLVEADEKFHGQNGSTPYFHELGRTSDQRADPYTNALHFYVSLLMSINAGRQRDGLEPFTPGRGLRIEIPDEIDDELVELDTSTNWPDYPKPEGLLKQITDLAYEASFCDTSILNLGGAIAMIGALASNRFQARISGEAFVTPNVYILNIARSGGGKDFIQKIIRRALGPHKLLGPAAYKSTSSFVMNLPEQPERLDLIDEATSLLNLSSSRNGYESGMGDLITELYSCSSNSYGGASSKKDGAGAFKTLRPHISIIGSTTPTGFTSSVSKTMMLKGMLPRFIIHHQADSGSYRRPDMTNEAHSKYDKAKEALFNTVNEFIKAHPKWKGALDEENILEIKLGPLENITTLEFTKEAANLFMDFCESNFNDNGGAVEYTKEFSGRWGESVTKIAMIHSIAVGRFDFIRVDSMQFAIQLILAQWGASLTLYNLASAENPIQDFAEKIIDRVGVWERRHPDKPLLRWELIRRLPIIDKRVSSMAFDSLVERKRLFSRIDTAKNGKPREVFSSRPFTKLK